MAWPHLAAAHREKRLKPIIRLKAPWVFGVLGFRGLGCRGLGFLGFRVLGVRGLGFGVFGVRGFWGLNKYNNKDNIGSIICMLLTIIPTIIKI